MRRRSYRWVVSTQAQYPAFESMLDRLAARLGPGLLITGSPHGSNGNHLDVVRGPSYHRGSLRQRARSWLEFAAFASARLAMVKTEWLLVLTNPPIMPAIAAAMTPVKHWRYGVLVWDMYPQALVDVGMLSSGHPVVRTWNGANRVTYAGAQFVATLSEEMADGLSASGVAPEKIVITPNWVDVEEIVPCSREDNSFLQERGLMDKFVVMYAGNIGAGHSLDGLVRAASRLGETDRFVFCVIGDGLGLEALQREVENAGVSCFRFWPPVSYAAFREAIAAPQLAVVSQRRGTESMSMPSKTYASLAAGVPILALTERDSSLGRLVAGEGVGVVCDPEEDEEIAEAISSLANDEDRRLAMSLRARRIAEERFSVMRAVSQFEHLFLSALEEKQVTL